MSEELKNLLDNDPNIIIQLASIYDFFEDNKCTIERLQYLRKYTNLALKSPIYYY